MIYLIRILFIAILTVLFGILGLLIGLVRPKNPKNTWLIARFYSLGLIILNIKLELRNKEGFNQNGPTVYISNHQHNLDVFPLGRIVPKNTVSVGKKEILWIPFFGLAYWLAGNVLINRGNRSKAWATMDSAVEALKANKTSLWIMPEGTRSKGRGVQRFKKGAFYTAIKAQVPIVPVAISSYHTNLNLTKFKSGKIVAKVLDPISTKGLTHDDITELSVKCQEIIAKEVEHLDRELQS